ncbi:MAG: hypothetical protein WC565_06040 [Parcubacteria group bacterium]|jgi:hypothetical protein
MTNEELARHTEALWALFLEYVRKHGIEFETEGVLIVQARATKPNAQPAYCIVYAGDPKNAAMTMTRAAMGELQKAGVHLPGMGGKQ